MKGSSILLAANPRGYYVEGTIDDTSKPGTHMQVVAASTSGDTRLHYQAANIGADGAPSLIMVLLEDDNQGKSATDAYVAGTRCRMYVPYPGEEMNVLVGEGAGTSHYAVGDQLMLDSDTGILIPKSGSPVSVPWVIQEKLAAQPEPSLVWSRYTGH